jgi:hypothetical protein
MLFLFVQYTAITIINLSVGFRCSPSRSEEEVFRDAARHGMKEHVKTQEGMIQCKVILKQQFVAPDNNLFPFAFYRES